LRNEEGYIRIMLRILLNPSKPNKTSPMSVTELVEAIGQEQSMISHNLRPLTRCKFVKRSRKGKHNIYYLNHETIDPILKAVEHHADKFCENGANCPLKAS